MEEAIFSAVIGELASRFISFLIDTCSKLLMAPPVTSTEEESLDHLRGVLVRIGAVVEDAEGRDTCSKLLMAPPVTSTEEESLDHLRGVLVRIGAVVEDAEGRRITNQAMLQQLDALRQEMHRGHLTLDTIRCQGRQHSFAESRSNPAKRLRICHRSADGESKRELQRVLGRLETAVQDAAEFVQLSGTYLPRLARQPYSMYLLLEKCMFCRQMEMERVVDFLLHGAHDHRAAEHLGVLPIIGPAYVGKSTLVEHACIDERVRSHFSQILLLNGGDLTDEDALSILANGVGVIKHENRAAAGRGRGRVLVILELDCDIREELWRRLYSVAKNCFARSSKIIVTSRSDGVVGFGTTLPLRLQSLTQEAYWYYFKVRSFGSVDMAMEHPKLTSIAMEMAREMSGCFMGASIFGGMLRSRIDVGTWSMALATYRAFRQMNSFLSAPNPVDPWALTRPILLPTPNRRSPGCVIVTGVALAHGDSAAPPKVPMQDDWECYASGQVHCSCLESTHTTSL